MLIHMLRDFVMLLIFPTIVYFSSVLNDFVVHVNFLVCLFCSSLFPLPRLREVHIPNNNNINAVAHNFVRKKLPNEGPQTITRGFYFRMYSVIKGGVGLRLTKIALVSICPGQCN